MALNKTGRAILLELDDWDSTKTTIESIRGSNNTAMSGPYGWAYGDFLMTGGQGCKGEYNNEQHLHCPGQSDVEYMTAFSIFAISGSPLLVATDIRNMTDIMKKVLLNTEIIAVNQQVTPGGNVAYMWGCSGPKDICQVWTRKLDEDDRIAVVLLNIDDKQHGITLDFAQLDMGWNNGTNVAIRDLWQHKDIGTYSGSYSTEVVPHGSFFYILTATDA